MNKLGTHFFLSWVWTYGRDLADFNSWEWSMSANTQEPVLKLHSADLYYWQMCLAFQSWVDATASTEQF